MIYLDFVIFFISLIILFWSGKTLVRGLIGMARFLRWKEFIVAFFVMAFAGCTPNLFVAVTSALKGIPQLSFGDVIGGNVVDLTLALALAVLIGRASIPSHSKLIQVSSVFTAIVAILPLVLILDGTLGRIDGLLLISFFFFYVLWIFSKKERFKKYFRKVEQPPVKSISSFLKSFGKVILAIFLLILAAQGIVESASHFAEFFALPLSLIGILFIGLANALPETYFSIIASKRGETWMILGDLMGSVIVSATLVLGTAALICPIEVVNFTSLAVARLFLVIAVLFFLIFVRTDRKITRREGICLLFIYLLFVIIQIFIR